MPLSMPAAMPAISDAWCRRVCATGLHLLVGDIGDGLGELRERILHPAAHRGAAVAGMLGEVLQGVAHMAGGLPCGVAEGVDEHRFHRAQLMDRLVDALPREFAAAGLSPAHRELGRLGSRGERLVEALYGLAQRCRSLRQGA